VDEPEFRHLSTLLVFHGAAMRIATYRSIGSVMVSPAYGFIGLVQDLDMCRFSQRTPSSLRCSTYPLERTAPIGTKKTSTDLLKLHFCKGLSHLSSVLIILSCMPKLCIGLT
jgi:hypothetical protein